MTEFMRFALRHGKESSEAQCLLINELAKSGAKRLLLLVSALTEEDVALKDYAARALGRIGIATPAVVSALCSVLRHPSVQVRQAAVVALSVLLPVPLAAESSLQTALSDADDEVRFYANDTLRQIEKVKRAQKQNLLIAG